MGISIGVFPESQEILVSGLRLGLVSRYSESSGQLQVRQCSNGIADHDPAMIENFLEFRGGFGALVFRQISLAAHIDRIESPEVAVPTAPRRA